MLLLRDRIIVRIVPTTWDLVIWTSTTATVYSNTQYIHVHRSRDDLQNFCHYCNCILPLFSMHVMRRGSSWITLTLVAQISFPYVPGTVMFGVSKRIVLLHRRPLPVGLFGGNGGEYVKTSVPWKRKPRAGQLD